MISCTSSSVRSAGAISSGMDAWISFPSISCTMYGPNLPILISGTDSSCGSETVRHSEGSMLDSRSSTLVFRPFSPL